MRAELLDVNLIPTPTWHLHCDAIQTPDGIFYLLLYEHRERETALVKLKDWE